MNWLQKIAQENPNEWGISKEDVEDMLQRMYYVNKEYFREDGILTWRQWFLKEKDYEIGLVLDSDRSMHDRHLHKLPEGVDAQDVVAAYRKGELPSKASAHYNYQQGPIEPTPVIDRNLPWQPQGVKVLTPDEAKSLYQLAVQKMSTSNAKEVNDHRKKLFIAYSTDPKLSDKIGIRTGELNKFITRYSGLSPTSMKLQNNLNNGVPEEHQWIGLSNSSFIMRQQLAHADLDSFVKSIDVSGVSQRFYNGDGGKSLRNYIARSFLSIDTRISYKDLSFEIGDCTKPTSGGTYYHNQRKIVIADVNPNTVAHEIGHYLDGKWGNELGSQNFLTLERVGHKPSSPIIDWANRFQGFMRNLSNKSEISSEYLQSMHEVFARFIDRFISWASREHHPNHYNYHDRFTESDYMTFVKILQEKSYLDAKNRGRHA